MRVLFFLQPGANSRSIFRDMIRGCALAGVETIIWELKPIWELYQRADQRAGDARAGMMNEVASIVATLIKANAVDLTIGMWANAAFSVANARRDGKPISFFDAIDTPHLAFWLDGPGWAHNSELIDQLPSPMLDGQHMHHLINNAAMADEMRRVLGMSNVLDLPYGVNEAVFRPVEGIERAFDVVCALGPGDEPPTELMLREVARDEPDLQAIRAEQAERIAPKLARLARRSPEADAMGRLFERLVASQLADRDRPVLARLDELCAADPSLAGAHAALLGDAGLFLRASALVRRIEHFERALTVTYLARRLGCAIFGGATLDGWDCPATDLGQLAYEDQASAYARGRMGLNVMRWQDDIGVNIKPIEIAACGSVGLMRSRVGLDRVLVPGEEIVVFESPAEALDKAQRLAGQADRLESIRAAGRARVLAEHTWTTRAGELLAALGTRTGRWTWPAV